MTTPQTSPPPPAPAYPATVPGRLLFIESSSFHYGDDLNVIAAFGTDGDGFTYVGNEKVWPEPVDKRESVCYNGEEKRWDDGVGQYPIEDKIVLDMSHPGWKKIFDQFFRAIDDEIDRRENFIGRAGEL